MKSFNAIIILWFLAEGVSVQAQRFTDIKPKDYLNSLGTIITGIGQEIPNLLPTPEELFQLPAQVLVGLPEKAIFQTINKLCSLYLASGTIEPRVTPDMDLLGFQLRTPCKEINFPLSEAEQILESPDFDVNKKVVIFVSGWRTSLDGDYIAEMANAYHCRGDYNFMALNASTSINTLYSWSAYNTEEVGSLMALALQKLVNKVPVGNIHLIGHSLGAHVAGSAGRCFTKLTGQNLTHITGLDPANPCFNEGESLSGIQRGDAEFIDIIHTNPGGLGKRDPVGDVDFYPGGLAPISPGCDRFGCSHGRAYKFYIESVYPGNEKNFLGVRCSSLTKLKRNFCNGPKFPMGFAVPYDLKGNYFLDVNTEEPYGQNNDNSEAVPSKCQNLCEQ